MQLTGKQIIERNIISGVDNPKQLQQQGIDVRVVKIEEVYGYGGFIPADGKTVIPKSEIVPTMFSDGVSVKCIPAGTKYWYLAPGYYELTFAEGCKVPNNCTLHFKTRSSLVRCGARVFSGQFDAGFQTDAMGCFLKCDLPIYIELNARVAQALVFESYPVDDENMYNGQWQNDQQRQK